MINMTDAGEVISVMIVLLMVALGVFVLLNILFGAISLSDVSTPDVSTNNSSGVNVTNVTEHTTAQTHSADGVTPTAHKTWAQRDAEWNTKEQVWLQKRAAARANAGKST